MKEQFKDQIIIDGLQYCNWNREIFEDLWKGGLTAVHATLVYWENTEESFKKIDKWNDLLFNIKILYVMLKRHKILLKQKKIIKLQ